MHTHIYTKLLLDITSQVLQSPTIDVTVTEEKLDEMLKELEDINKSIASPSSSDDENDTTDHHRKFMTLMIH